MCEEEPVGSTPTEMVPLSGTTACRGPTRSSYVWETGYWAGSAYGQGDFHSEHPVLMRSAMEEQMGFGGRGHGRKLASILLLYHGGLRALVYITSYTLQSRGQSWRKSNTIRSWIPTFNSSGPGRPIGVENLPWIVIPLSAATSVS